MASAHPRLECFLQQVELPAIPLPQVTRATREQWPHDALFRVDETGFRIDKGPTDHITITVNNRSRVLSDGSAVKMKEVAYGCWGS